MPDAKLFNRIMVPVELANKDSLERALTAAGDLSGHYGAPVVYVGVTSNVPSAVGHSVEEFREKLEALAQEQAKAHGIEASAHVKTALDPTADMNRVLREAIDETGADLVVMQSHVPHVLDYIWASHGGYLAEHAKISVMVIR